MGPGNQLFERLKLLITDPALYPEMPFSTDEVPRAQMHFFTIVQFMVVGVLFAVAKSPIALAFPIFLVSSIPLRAYLHKISGGFITQDMVQILDCSKKPAKSGADANDEIGQVGSNPPDDKVKPLKIAEDTGNAEPTP